MPFTVATWNINSVRLRLDLVQRYLGEHAPDVLCLQETKCPDELFPREAFEALGYGHVAIHGQKGYHGVAVISKLPFGDVVRQTFCGIEHARHLSVRLEVNGRPLRLHNFYVPAGGDEPDPAINDKFKHKLDFIEEMRRVTSFAEPETSAILVGDLNIAPYETDVWSHKQLLKIVSHTPVETEGLLVAMQDGAWADLIRARVPMEEKVYTWWSYRAKDWLAADKGRRLDHIWGSGDLVPRLLGHSILKDARGWDRPSDHVPLSVTLDL
ncbi:exodeoxyribonuclease III [Aureimonas endophytica]|uniref:Exodeoxyribonuclease III n=1 Tax=Aureimonas endophytica TaxID=2027858 RepID=A0A916ZQK5_9HYPH|nr:exodeoxyribonuclease III [Aureimonas endophytica]GGE08147.1 exodeoxyribonuclease III [Aureimonas endophytica]